MKRYELSFEVDVENADEAELVLEAATSAAADVVGSLAVHALTAPREVEDGEAG